MTSILFSRLIGPVPVDVIVRETHRNTLGITENPIETGAKVTDHAYVEPKKLTLEFASDNAVATYNALVRFQESRVPFIIVSGLTVYQNMLIKELRVTRDATYSRVLDGLCELQEAIIVSTAYTSAQGDSGSEKSNAPSGGQKTNRSATPTKERTSGNVTQDRASGTTMRGDAKTATVPTNNGSGAATGSTRQSLLKRLF
jgi:hypothetical protein